MHKQSHCHNTILFHAGLCTIYQDEKMFGCFDGESRKAKDRSICEGYHGGESGTRMEQDIMRRIDQESEARMSDRDSSENVQRKEAFDLNKKIAERIKNKYYKNKGGEENAISNRGEGQDSRRNQSGREEAGCQHDGVRVGKDRDNRREKIMVGFLLALFLLTCTIANAQEYNNATDEQIVDAIGKAENSKGHPYGILAHYKNTTPRQACLNTVRSSRRRFIRQNKEKDFIHFLSLTYCPIDCSNDNGTNKYWEKNVKFFLYKRVILNDNTRQKGKLKNGH